MEDFLAEYLCLRFAGLSSEQGALEFDYPDGTIPDRDIKRYDCGKL